MTSAELQAALHQRPFNPFTLHASDGMSYGVPSADFIAHKPGTRLCIVLSLRDSGVAWLDLAHMVRLTFDEPLSAEQAG
jgi:hypothetical protein